VADFDSMDSDGFTIDITDAPGSAYRIGYMAIGGTDITNTAIGSFQQQNVEGSQSVTGVGFRPDFVFFISEMDNRSEGSVGSDLKFMLGFTSGVGESGSIGIFDSNGEGTSNATSLMRSDRFMTGIDEDGVIEVLATLVSFDSDGFTFDLDLAEDDSTLYYLAIKGGQWHVDSFSAQSSTGEFDVTDTNYTPKGVFFLSGQRPTATTVYDDMKYSIGAASSDTDCFSIGGVSQDNVGTSQCFDFSDDGEIYKCYNDNETLYGSIAFVEFLSNGFTLNQTDAETASQNEIAYFVVCEAVPPIPAGAYFPGTIMATTTSTLVPPTYGSVSFWMCATELSTGIYRIMGTDDTWEIRLSQDSGTWKLWNDLGQQTSPYLSSTSRIWDNTWYHIVCTYGASSAGEIYIDGVLDASNSTLGGSKPSGYLSIGGRTGSADYFIGYLEDLRIYDRVLSATEVATIYACRGSDSIMYGQLNRYMLNELPAGVTSSVSGVIKDSGLNGYNATPTGSGLIWSGSTLKKRMYRR